MSPPKDALSPAPYRQPLTTLQSHVAFFDSDGDGIIWPRDTYSGSRAIGFSAPFSVLIALVIHGAFSYLTFGTWLPDPFFRLRISLMHRAKHGSDSESFTHKGEFNEERFEDLFNSYSAPPHDSLSLSETLRMIHGNRNPLDLFGWTAALFEWGVAYLLLWPKNGRMTKDDLRGILDGSLFYRREKMNNNTRAL